MTEEILTFDTMQIMEMIPHRYPFLLVDRITECVAGKYAKGYKNMTMNEEFFQGHFPGNPIMPGVLQLEALAQCNIFGSQLSGLYALLAPNISAKDSIKNR